MAKATCSATTGQMRPRRPLSEDIGALSQNHDALAAGPAQPMAVDHTSDEHKETMAAAPVE